MSIAVEIPPETNDPEKTLGIINQLNFFLRPGDPSPQEGRQRVWQKCFTLGLPIIIKGDLNAAAAEVLDDSKEWCWRYMIGFSCQDALYATFDKTLRAVGLSRGVEAAAALEAALNLKSLPGTETGTYVVRVVTIPGLLTEVFWLWPTAAQPGDGFVVPFLTAQDLRRGYPYKPQVFFDLASGLAPSDETLAKQKKPAAKTAETMLTYVQSRRAKGSKERPTPTARLLLAGKLQEQGQTMETSAQKQSWKRVAKL
jgi:hypothetical protein